AEGTVRTEDGARILVCGIDESSAVIVLDQLLNLVEVVLEIRDKYRAGENGIGDRFGYLRFTTARDGAGFVAYQAFGQRTDQSPGAVRAGFFHAQLVTGRA